MAITNGYATLAEVHKSLGIETSDVADDARLEQMITAVSRTIDNYCRRRFYTTANDETRDFTATNSLMVATYDIVSITSVATDDAAARTWTTTWTTTDYLTMPANASLNGEPIIGLIVAANGRYRFPMYTGAVRIVGKFGYGSTAPDVVREACVLQAARLFKRKDSPLGIAGTNALGAVVMVGDLDPDVKALLAPPIRRLNRA